MSDQVGPNTEENVANLASIDAMEVGALADEVKAGDDAINKLKVQNLDFILDIPLKAGYLHKQKVFPTLHILMPLSLLLQHTSLHNKEYDEYDLP